MVSIRIKILVVCLLIFNIVVAQQEIDPEKTMARLAMAQDDKMKVELLNQLALYYSNNDIKKSQEYGSQALELAKKIDDLNGIADSQYALGRIFLNTYYDLSFDLISKSLKVYQENKDTLKIGKCYTIFGIIKSNLKEYNTALDYYTRALDIYKSKNDTTLIASALNNIGTCYASQMHQTQAEYYFEQAVSLNKIKGNKMYLSVNYSNLGQASSEQHDYIKAKYYLNKSLALKRELNDQNGIAGLYGILGTIYYQNGSLDSAIIYFSLADQKAKYLENYRLQESVASSLTSVYKEHGMIDSAFAWVQRLLTIRDSISSIEKTQDINMMELKMQYENEQKSIAIQHHKKVNRLSITIYILSLLILITLTIIYLLNLRRKKIRFLNEKISNEKKHLNELFELKSREVTSNALNLISKNELIKKTIDTLQSGLYKISDENKADIQKIIAELNANFNKNIWKEFKIRFDQIHPDFYNKLLHDFPNLTQNELRLCAFLRMNMSTKEISLITYQNVDSIEKARIRLRKKLNISETGINMNYFLNNY